MRLLLFLLLLVVSAVAIGETEVPPAPAAPEAPVAADAVPKADPAKPFLPRIYLVSDVTLRGAEWAQLNLSEKASFLAPLDQVWLKWLKENLPPTVNDAQVCQDACLAYYKQWLERPEGQPVAEDEYRDGLWLVVSFDLGALLASQNRWKFNWEGRLVLIDVNTKKIIQSGEIPKETLVSRGPDQKEVNSQLASRLYRSAVGNLPPVIRKNQPPVRHARVGLVSISGNRNLGDVLNLMEKLQQEGRKLSLVTQLDAFTQKEATLLCFYQGEEKRFTDFLSQVKELNSSGRYRLVHFVDGDTHSLKFQAN